MKKKSYILVGNSFPLSLIRRSVRMEIVSLADLQAAANGAEVVSFWGHLNTLKTAEDFCGLSLTPLSERPAIFLSDDGFPSLNRLIFRECWVLSPDYIANFRPQIGEEVSADKIGAWQILKITWED